MILSDSGWLRIRSDCARTTWRLCSRTRTSLRLSINVGPGVDIVVAATSPPPPEAVDRDGDLAGDGDLSEPDLIRFRMHRLLREMTVPYVRPTVSS